MQSFIFFLRSENEEQFSIVFYASNRNPLKKKKMLYYIKFMRKMWLKRSKMCFLLVWKILS